jgi:hypothetical protein
MADANFCCILYYDPRSHSLACVYRLFLLEPACVRATLSMPLWANPIQGAMKLTKPKRWLNDVLCSVVTFQALEHLDRLR